MHGGVCAARQAAGASREVAAAAHRRNSVRPASRSPCGTAWGGLASKYARGVLGAGGSGRHLVVRLGVKGPGGEWRRTRALDPVGNQAAMGFNCGMAGAACGSVYDRQ